MKYHHQTDLFITAVLIPVFLSFTACNKNHETAKVHTFSGLTMGTSYNVEFISQDNISKSDVKHDIESILDEINAGMSTYLEDSELSRINRSGPDEWIPVSDDLYTVLQAAMDISLKSDGAFDVTVAPLVNLWGFGPDDRPVSVPEKALIDSVMQNTGFRKMSLDRGKRAIRKSTASLMIDLSAIAKGYAVDKITTLLAGDYAFDDFLVEVGGELRASGYNRTGQRWRIGVERPESSRRVIQRVISLEDEAMATSGGYRNYYDLEGTRYSHTIDPVTGRPVTHNLLSVTVLHESAMIADAWATAMLVMGAERAKVLAETHGLAVLLITSNGNGFQEIMTGNFRKRIVNPE